MKTVSEYRAIIPHFDMVKAVVADLTEPDADICEVLARGVEAAKTKFMPDKHYDELIYKLKNAIHRVDGFKFIGDGAFSLAFSGPDDMVYKVNAVKRRLPDAWLAFAVSAAETGSPLFPIIEKITCIKNTYCVKMERLIDRFEIRSRDRIEAHYLNHAISENNVGRFAELIGCEYDEAKAVVSTIRKVRVNINAKFDLHNNNLMYRLVDGEYFPVLLDPLASWHVFDTTEYTGKLATFEKQEPRKLVRPKTSSTKKSQFSDPYALALWRTPIPRNENDGFWEKFDEFARWIGIDPKKDYKDYKVVKGREPDPAHLRFDIEQAWKVPVVRKRDPFWVNPKGKGWNADPFRYR